MPSGVGKWAVWVCASLLLAAAPRSFAQSISYTVQVVALSDRDAALTVVSDLLRQGYPAYVVRSTSAQGDVFRVRVGAYANRGAAVLYAAAMPAVAGGQPVPALAEAIPPGITPLAPRLLVQEAPTGAEVRLLPLPDGLAVRIQRRAPLAEAEYLLVSGGTVERVRAWQWSVSDTGERVRVRTMMLWPDTWQSDSAEVRDGFRASLVALVAERLGVTVEEVAAAEFQTALDEVPRLIVVERVVPGAADGPELLGIGLPASGLTPAGPVAYLGLDPATLPVLQDGVRVDLASGTIDGRWGDEVVHRDGASTDVVVGDGWSAVADGPFVRLTLGAPAPAGAVAGSAQESAQESGQESAQESAAGPAAEPAPEPAPGAAQGAATEPAPEPATEPAQGAATEPATEPAAQAQASPPATPSVTWRAAVGLPLWSDGPRLVALHDGALLIYDFLPR